MASTLRLNDAFDYAKLLTKNVPLENVQVRILQDALHAMWMAAPWRWTLNTMGAITLVANQQDYAITIPTDFLYLIECYLTDSTATTSGLHIEPYLPVAGIVGMPNKIALIGSSLRLHPKPPTFSSVPSIITLYKKSCPIINPVTVNVAGTQVFDDEWFWVYTEAVLWKAYQYADDQRAGTVTYTSDGKYQVTGQRACFEAALEQMRQREKIPTFDMKSLVQPEETGKR